MSRARFVIKNGLRNKRRTLLTILSIAFSLLLLTLMISVYRGFYIDQGTADSALRLITRHRVSLTFFLPSSYEQKIRAIPGVVDAVPMEWFGGIYKDDRPENFFAQMAVNPEELFSVYKDWKIPPDQLQAWIRDRAGAVVDRKLADKHRWKLGDRLTLQGTIFPVNPELTIRGIYETPVTADQGLYFNWTYVEEAVRWAKGQTGLFAILVDSPESVARIAAAIDDEFRNAPEPTKTESEKAFQLDFVSMLGNVKAFILSITLAVVFAILLVSANTMAMSIRERTREVALLKTLGFTPTGILTLFVAEAVALALVGGVLGVLAAKGLAKFVANSPAQMLADLTITFPTILVALLVAVLVGLLSAILPAYRASRLNIVDGLRHIG
ncbi:MAG: ABC transporter permease [Acidobacteriia bacterium]|nr:ABC transporter permease [Terriglobia bacterium]